MLENPELKNIGQDCARSSLIEAEAELRVNNATTVHHSKETAAIIYIYACRTWNGKVRDSGTGHNCPACFNAVCSVTNFHPSMICSHIIATSHIMSNCSTDIFQILAKRFYLIFWSVTIVWLFDGGTAGCLTTLRFVLVNCTNNTTPLDVPRSNSLL